MKQIQSIEVAESNQQLVYHVVLLEIEKGQIKINQSVCELTSLEAVEEHIDQTLPIALVLNVRGVLHKKTSADSTTQLLQKILPNASPDDFYVQYQSIGTLQIGSVIRKVQLEKYLAPILEKKWWIVNLVLGNFHVQSLLPYCESLNYIDTSTQQLFIDNQSIIDFTKSTGNYQNVLLGDERKDSRLLPAIGVGVTTMSAWSELKKSTQLNSTISPELNDYLEVPAIAQLRKEYLNFKRFKQVGWAVLVGFLCVLLFNYLLFSQFSSSLDKVNYELYQKESQLKLLDSLQQKYSTQYKLFENGNISKPSKAAYYSDRLAATLPSSIHLEQLHLFPLLKQRNRKKEDPLIFEQDKILIKGTVDNSLTYTAWKTRLEGLKWVEKIEQVGYQERDNVGQFEVWIQIKEAYDVR